MDLPDTEFGRFGLPVTLPTAEETDTITGIVGQMARWMEEMKECAAGGDLLRLLHLSNTLQENNSWLAGYVDKVMDCRS